MSKFNDIKITEGSKNGHMAAGMRILVVINDVDLGGAQRVAIQQANELASRGYDVSLLTLLSDPATSLANDLHASITRIHLANTGFDLKSLLRIRAVLKCSKYDVVITHLFLANTLVRTARLMIATKPYVFTYEHNVYSKEKRTRHFVIDWMLSFFTHKLIAVSDEVRNELIKKGISNRKIEVIKNGVAITAPKTTGLNRSMFANPEQALFVAVGHVIPQKGHDLLVEAAQRLIKRGKNARILVIGPDDGDFAESLKAKILANGLENVLVLMGARKDAVEIVRMADCYIMPSRYEGMSIALLEALMLKKPVIVSDLPGYQGWLIDGVNALIHRQLSAESLAEKMLWVIDNPANLIAIGDAGYLASREYTIEINVDRLMSVVRACSSVKGYARRMLFIKIKSILSKGKIFNLSDQRSDKWTSRAVAAIGLLQAATVEPWVTVADLGCGDQKIKTLLVKNGYSGFHYQGFDLVPQKNDVIPMDFNHGQIDTSYDIVFCLGLIEYLDNIKAFLTSLKRNAKHVVLSSVVSDKGLYSQEDVRNRGWKNYLSQDELEHVFTEIGFTIAEKRILDSGVTRLYLLK